jgi:DUF971 family protein
MPTAPDPRKKPTAVKIHVSTGAGVDISWADGHASHYDFPYLRDACPCATCNDEREKKNAAESKHGNTASAAASVPLPTTSPAFPMYKPKARAQSATSVGSYAIQINFSDGHNTGIYSYEQLRMICPCQACAEAFRKAG